MGFSECDGDNSFGPVVHGCREDFDFTLKFEGIFFAIAPSSVFIALSLVRVAYVLRCGEIVKGFHLRGLKLVRLCHYSKGTCTCLLIDL